MVWASREIDKVLFKPWKKRGVQSRIRKLIVERKETTDPKEKSKTSKRPMKHFLNETSQKPVS